MKYIYLVTEDIPEGIEIFTTTVAAFTKESEAHKFAACNDMYSVITVPLDEAEKHWVRVKYVDENPPGRYRVAKHFVGTDDV